MSEDSYSTTLFSVPFTNFTVSSTLGPSAYDLWSIKASTLTRVAIREVNIGQLSTNVTGNQQLAIQCMRGSTALGSGAPIIPNNLKGWSGAPAALSSATGPTANLASTASATVIVADTSDWSGNWNYKPSTYREFVLEAGQTFNVRVYSPPTAVQLSGTLTFEEIAKP